MDATLTNESRDRDRDRSKERNWRQSEESSTFSLTTEQRKHSQVSFKAENITNTTTNLNVHEQKVSSTTKTTTEKMLDEKQKQDKKNTNSAGRSKSRRSLFSVFFHSKAKENNESSNNNNNNSITSSTDDSIELAKEAARCESIDDDLSDIISSDKQFSKINSLNDNDSYELDLNERLASEKSKQLNHPHLNKSVDDDDDQSWQTNKNYIPVKSEKTPQQQQVAVDGEAARISRSIQKAPPKTGKSPLLEQFLNSHKIRLDSMGFTTTDDSTSSTNSIDEESSLQMCKEPVVRRLPRDSVSERDMRLFNWRLLASSQNAASWQSTNSLPSSDSDLDLLECQGPALVVTCSDDTSCSSVELIWTRPRATTATINPPPSQPAAAANQVVSKNLLDPPLGRAHSASTSSSRASALHSASSESNVKQASEGILQQQSVVSCKGEARALQRFSIFELAKPNKAKGKRFRRKKEAMIRDELPDQLGWVANPLFFKDKTSVDVDISAAEDDNSCDLNSSIKRSTSHESVIQDRPSDVQEEKENGVKISLPNSDKNQAGLSFQNPPPSLSSPSPQPPPPIPLPPKQRSRSPKLPKTNVNSEHVNNSNKATIIIDDHPTSNNLELSSTTQQISHNINGDDNHSPPQQDNVNTIYSSIDQQQSNRNDDDSNSNSYITATTKQHIADNNLQNCTSTARPKKYWSVRGKSPFNTKRDNVYLNHIINFDKRIKSNVSSLKSQISGKISDTSKRASILADQLITSIKDTTKETTELFSTGTSRKDNLDIDMPNTFSTTPLQQSVSASHLINHNDPNHNNNHLVDSNEPSTKKAKFSLIYMHQQQANGQPVITRQPMPTGGACLWPSQDYNPVSTLCKENIQLHQDDEQRYDETKNDPSDTTNIIKSTTTKVLDEKPLCSNGLLTTLQSSSETIKRNSECIEQLEGTIQDITKTTATCKATQTSSDRFCDKAVISNLPKQANSDVDVVTNHSEVESKCEISDITTKSPTKERKDSKKSKRQLNHLPRVVNIATPSNDYGGDDDSNSDSDSDEENFHDIEYTKAKSLLSQSTNLKKFRLQLRSINYWRRFRMRKMGLNYNLVRVEKSQSLDLTDLKSSSDLDYLYSYKFEKLSS